MKKFSPTMGALIVMAVLIPANALAGRVIRNSSADIKAYIVPGEGKQGVKITFRNHTKLSPSYIQCVAMVKAFGRRTSLSNYGAVSEDVPIADKLAIASPMIPPNSSVTVDRPLGKNGFFSGGFHADIISVRCEHTSPDPDVPALLQKIEKIKSMKVSPPAGQPEASTAEVKKINPPRVVTPDPAPAAAIAAEPAPEPAAAPAIEEQKQPTRDSGNASTEE